MTRLVFEYSVQQQHADLHKPLSKISAFPRKYRYFKKTSPDDTFADVCIFSIQTAIVIETTKHFFPPQQKELSVLKNPLNEKGKGILQSD